MKNAEFVKRCASHRRMLTAYIQGRISRTLGVLYSAEDLCQETFLDAYMSRNGFHSEGNESFKSWLFRIADTTIIDKVRFHNRLRRNPGNPIQSVRATDVNFMEALSPRIQSTPTSGPRMADSFARVQYELRQLPDLWREMIYLRFYETLTLEEVAARCGVSKTTAIKTINDALAKMRLKLGTSGDYI